MTPIPAHDLIVGHTFQIRKGEHATRYLVVLADKRYAVPLDGPSTGYAEPFEEFIDPAGTVFLTYFS